MRKILLLGASALAVAAGSTAAFAEDPVKVTLSGTGQEWFGYASNNKSDVGNTSKLFEASNNSFGLNGSTKLDNGITVSVSLNMNASPGVEGSNFAGKAGSPTGITTDGTASPETNFVGFSGAFGSINLGFQPNAALGNQVDAPVFGVGGLSWSRVPGWVVSPTGGTSNINAQTTIQDDYWANKVVYSTPSFSGLQVTASFTPDMTARDGGPSKTVNSWAGNSESVSVNYGGDFGSVKVKAQVAYTSENFNGISSATGAAITTAALGSGQGAHLKGYSGGLNVSFSGLTIGGALADRTAGGLPAAGTTANQTAKTGLATGVTWDVGITYAMGPWGIGAGYLQQEADNNSVTGNATGKEKYQQYGINFQYTLGPGITITEENWIVDWKLDPNTASTDKNHGWTSVLGTTVNF